MANCLYCKKNTDECINDACLGTENKDEKLITFSIVSPTGSYIIDTDLRNVCQAVFGCNNDRSITAEQINEIIPDTEDDEAIEYKIVIEKRYTQKDLDNMPESDGDIH